MESGTQSGNSFNALKESIAGKLDRAAGCLGQSEEGSPRGPYNQQASEWLRQSADYVRNFDVKRADMHLRNQIRAYPGRSMLISLAAGMLIGFWIRRR
jgi:hypothetical protein